MKFQIAVVTYLLQSAASITLKGSPQLNLAAVHYDASAVAELEKTFNRPEEVHRQSMVMISSKLTIDGAVKVLENTSFANTSTLKQIASLIAGTNNLRSVKLDNLKGFGGLDGARKLLNEMIHESMVKYDGEIAKCTDFYAKQCALMETARSQIAGANYIANTARALILDAQDNIKKCDRAIPETKQELKDHNRKCKLELEALQQRLATVQDDIEVITMILEMSDCDAPEKKLLQTDQFALMRCEDQCTNKQTVSFQGHDKLQREVDQLKSSEAKQLLAETFADLFDDDSEVISSVTIKYDDPDDGAHKLQLRQKQPKKELPPKELPGKGELAAKTKFNNPPVPKTKVPGNPCTDPNKGAPSAEDKRAAKCTLKKSPKCYKLQQRFLQIQGAITDDRDDLMDQISKLEATCKETKDSLQASIDTDEALLSSSQTKLATAMEKESSAGENGRQVSKENDEYDADLQKQMKVCSTNYVNFETELCALRKIRGDLFKKMQKGHDGFFQDCEVDKWTPAECSKACEGGTQTLTRTVLSHPGPKAAPGADCLPLKAERSCNYQQCPVDCILEMWGGWGKCSSKCGGGMTQRVRDVQRAALHKGNQCGATTETKSCNMAACEKDCVLHQWTAWTACSKDCDGGTAKRQRLIKEPAQGEGKCAGKWELERLEYRSCNEHRCVVPNGTVLKCNQTLDVVLLLDATPKGGKDAWAAEVKLAHMLIDAFSGPNITAVPNFAILTYTGPRTWYGVSKCTGESTEKVDMEKDCHVKIAQHFTEKSEEAKSVVSGAQYQAGSKLLSLALMTVKSELALGRPTARTNVIVLMDGEPLSYRKTLLTSQQIRKKARLVYVPIVKFSPLAAIKKWASRRWQENIVTVESAEELMSPATGTHIIADICPNKFPELALQSKRK